MGFRALRVLNDDRVAPAAGFPTHGHRDAEILSYVLDGELMHEDSMGNGSVIRAGEIQRMSAGRGVMHSEFNASTRDPVHFLQIWLVPAERGIAPGYEQRALADERGALRAIATPEGGEGAVRIHCDARVLRGLIGAGERARHELAPGRHAWVHVARGRVTLEAGGQRVDLGPGDGAGLSGEPGLAIEGAPAGEVLVFDLA